MRKILATLIVFTACTHAVPVAPPAPPSPQVVLSAIQHEAETNPSADTYGKAALASFIVTGDPAKTTSWISKALDVNPNQPDALYARLLVARESLSDRLEAEAALALVQHPANSEFIDLAAFRLREVAGTSPAIDRLIAEGLAGLHSDSMNLRGASAFKVREALVGIFEAHNDDEKFVQGRADVGTPTVWQVVGPLQPLRMRDFDRADPFDDPSHVLAAAYPGPIGSVSPRLFDTPSGALDMEHETWRADVFDALTDMETKVGGRHLVAIRGVSELIVYVDGVKVAERRPMPSRPPDRTWAGVDLSPGKHRIRVKFSRIDSGGFSLFLPREDGAPSDLTFSAPAVGEPNPAGTTTSFAPASGEKSGDDPVTRFLRVQRLSIDDGDAARAEFEGLLATLGESPAVRSLDADLTTGDPELPRANIVGRVAQDLDAVLKIVPGDARAIQGRFQQERNDKRYEPAEARLALLTAVVGESQPRVLIERARFALERGNAAQARKLADEALKVDAGRCDALGLRTDLARRDNEAAVTKALVPQSLNCPGGLTANATFLRNAGHTPDALPLLRRVLARNPSSGAARRTLADALYAEGDSRGAVEVEKPLLTLWPRDDDALKRLASWRELNGADADALGLYKQALQIDGSDLSLTRGLDARSNAEVLGWAARDGLAAIAEYKKTGFPTLASAVQVLDFGALEILPNGAQLERVQSVVQVLDKRGIGQFGEVNIPTDAQPLIVRTIKADGRILDAEAISGKESISLPNLEPGDFAEYSFVRAQAPRAAAMSGWSGGQFVFQADEVPFFESTYVVKAPVAVGMEIDRENIDDPPKVQIEGDSLVLTYTRHRMPPHLPEPFAVSDLEVMPWLEAGTGVGQEALAAQLGDWVPTRARSSLRVQEFVRGMLDLPVKARIPAIVDHIREELRGDSNSMDFSDSAGTILARKRGNRMLVLKAALAAVGIPSHILLARPFNESPHDFRFPHAASYRVALLRIEPPGAAPMWMDFTLRQAPLDKLPSVVSGQEAWIVPNDASEKVVRLTLPLVNPEDDRTDSKMEFTLDKDGNLTGTMNQYAYGFDAAGLRHRFEQINATELRKAQEGALASNFHGLTLTEFVIKDTGDPSTPVVAISTIQVPGYTEKRGAANGGNETTIIHASFGPLELGRRFIRRAERSTPLLLSVDDLSRSEVIVHLPAGTQPQLPDAVDVKTPFGAYREVWKAEKDQLTMNEEFTVHRGRIAPDKYPAFKGFAAAVDAAQSREVPLW